MSRQNEEEPEYSDGEIDSVGFPSDISCNDYSDDDARDEALDVEIEMDFSPNKTNMRSNTQPKSNVSTTVAAPVAVATPTKPVIAKKAIVKKESSKEPKLDAKLELKKEIKKPTTRESKKTATWEGETEVKAKKEAKEQRKEEKESATDAKFQFNEETIEYFSKDILGDVKKICIPNSTFNNDTALLCLLIKLGIIKEYKCVEKKCKTGKTWLGQPIQLLIHRKNGKMHDLSESNLELMCANCYIAKYGLDMFIKVAVRTIYKCSYCGYPLGSKFTNSKKKERICMACESRIMTSGYFEQRSRFIDQLSDTIDEASTLKKDEFKSSNYYSQVSQFKSFDSIDSNTRTSRTAKSESSTKTFNNKPIIALNLTVPNIEDLITEE